MTTRRKPYPTMKPSGVEWLGDVPAHWNVWQLGRMGWFFKGNGGTKEDEIEHGIACVRYGDIYTRHQFVIRSSRAGIAEERTASYTPIQYGDILFAGSGETIEEIGKSAVNLMDGPAYCGGDVIVFRPSIEVNAAFLGYAVDCPQSAYQKSRMGRGITVVHIYSDELKYMTVFLPPPDEQAAIVRYLDYVDLRIHRYIRAKQRLIELLEEEKQAMTHQAVTRGLDPDVPLRPSGVEWLGDVPEHWSVERLGSLLRERGETNDAGSVTHVLSVLRKRGVIPYDEKGRIGNKKSEDITRYKIVRPRDIVLNSMNVIIGSVGLSSYTGCLSPVYYVLTPRSDDDARYLNAVFQVPTFHRSLVKIGNGILAHRMRIPMELLKCELLPRPPVGEQAAIVGYLARATARVDWTIGRARREIELLHEYRTRLIADVVTGKLDVREAAAHLPEVAPDGLEHAAELAGASEDELLPEFREAAT